MITQRTDRALGHAAMIFVCGISLVTIGVAAALAVPSIRSRFVSGATGDYAVGQTVDIGSEFYRLTPYTVVIFSSSTCSACVASQGLFSALVRQSAAIHGVRVMLASPEPDESAEVEFAAKVGLSRTSVALIPASALRLRSVPTVVIVNKRGTVLAVHKGAPNKTTSVEELSAKLLAQVRRL